MRFLAIRNRVYPKDLNPNGTAFGGFIMSQMDKAASIMVDEMIIGKAVTVFVDNLHFKHPLRNGDIFSVYVEPKKIGTTSMHFNVTFITRCIMSREEYVVCEALFIFVAVDDKGKPIPVKPLLRDSVDPALKA